MRNTLSHLILMIEIFVSFLTFCVNSLNKFSTIPRFCPLCVRTSVSVFRSSVCALLILLHILSIFLIVLSSISSVIQKLMLYPPSMFSVYIFKDCHLFFFTTIGRIFCVLLLIFDISLAAPKWGSCLLIFVCVILFVIFIVVLFIIKIGGPFPLDVADIVHGEFASFVDFTVATTYNRCIGEFRRDCFK